MTAPDLQEPDEEALATLDREWDGLAAHRDYPMTGLDNNPAERALHRPVVTRKNAYGSRNQDAARLAAPHPDHHRHRAGGRPERPHLPHRIPRRIGRNHGKPLTGPDLERFLPWHAGPGNLRTWAQPPPARITAPEQPTIKASPQNVVTPPAWLPNHGTSE